MIPFFSTETADELVAAGVMGKCPVIDDGEIYAIITCQ